eukprot:349172_1
MIALSLLILHWLIELSLCVASTNQKGITIVIGTEGANCTDIETLKAHWFYNWQAVDPKCNINIPWIPMIWSQAMIKDIKSLTNSKYEALLGFNEPDNKGQSDMTVEYALSLWPQLMSTNLRLGSPGCTEGGTWSWLKQFMEGIESNKSLRVDFIAVHWYGDCTKPQTLNSFLSQVNSTYEKYPFWLTEFSCINGNEQLNDNFFKAALPILQSYDRLERYSWFTDRWPTNGKDYPGVTLFDTKSHLTQVDVDYMNAP